MKLHTVGVGHLSFGHVAVLPNKPETMYLILDDAMDCDEYVSVAIIENERFPKLEKLYADTRVIDCGLADGSKAISAVF